MTDFKTKITELCTKRSKEIEEKAFLSLDSILTEIASNDHSENSYSGQHVNNTLDVAFVNRMANLEYLK